ncbi:MAG: discoidin domain-containing protein, partial [Planctomycetota bacterium]|nr:discoidin domain-containing protein [Planctomycetota bacterium]
ATVSRSHDGANPIPGPPAPPRFRLPDSNDRGTSSATADNAVLQKDTHGLSNLALGAKAKAAASSAITGFEIHKIANLNDGRSGNAHSWVAENNPAWAEIDLGDVYWVHKVAFGNDSSGKYADRAATSFKILTATEHNPDSKASNWKTALRRSGDLTVKRRAPFAFKPVRARWVRVSIDATNRNAPRIDELEIFGQKDPIPASKLDRIDTDPPVLASDEIPAQSLMGEEHAWLKTYGRADLSPRLVPYNGRVKEYPRHVDNDRLPLAPLAGKLKLDGKLDDACWKTASRGVVRVAWPYDYATGPLVETAVSAGYIKSEDAENEEGQDLALAFETNRLLSGHLAVISDGHGDGRGVLALTGDGIVFRRYKAGLKKAGLKLDEEVSLRAGFNESRTRCEVRLPLSLFPDWKKRGLKIGLGMGGKHTSGTGHAISFSPATLSIAAAGPCRGGTFRVRFSVAAGGKTVTISGKPAAARPASPSMSAPESTPLPAELIEGLSVSPGESKVVSIPTKPGPIGPECNLTVVAKTGGRNGDTYTLNLFRYDPLQRTLALFDKMIARSAAKGMEVAAERRRLAELGRLQEKLQTARTPDVAAERKAFRDARVAKRRLFFRDADLKPIEKLLFVKRHAFEPSHNYSVNLDSRWRPGGAICTIEIPRQNGRFQPEKAKLTELFNAGKGIARTPMAGFNGRDIFFAFRASKPEYYHVMRTMVGGGDAEQLTDGPFHDYWPCPLPDGGLAFITTRCKCRYLCWRPQAAVMFRMDADGENMQALSFANLSEWAPSVMSDGRIIWTRSEYVDKGADFSHTLWAMRPDGTKPELVFGNTIIQPNGYANGRQVPGTKEICCTLISHFGDLNGPIALVDTAKGRFTRKAIKSITPEVPWPGSWPREECFRDALPLAKDFFLCSHSPRYKFGIYVIDRYGNREPLYFDDTYGCMCVTPLRAVEPPPALRRIEGRIVESSDGGTSERECARAPGNPAARLLAKQAQAKSCNECPTDTILAHASRATSSADGQMGQFALSDVYQGIDHIVPRGSVKYIRVSVEVRDPLEQLENGEYRQDHDPFQHFYAAPVDLVSGPYGWPSYIAKASLGLAPVEEDGSAHFHAPAGKQLYLQILDKDFNELQRMRSVVQLQPGERRGCVGCHEDRRRAPSVRQGIALRRGPDRLEPPPWGAKPVDYQEVVQPVLTAKCVQCHGANDNHGLDLTGRLDKNRIPQSYRTLITQGWVHFLDYGYNSGGNEKAQPMTFGTLKSRLWKLLDAGHYDVELSTEEMRRIKVWIDLNCPLWPDYKFRENRPLAKVQS